MSKVVLDFGSANTCKNNKSYIKRMYDELRKVDTKVHEIIVKWQLFQFAGPNIPLTHECFQFAYEYGNELGYKVTSSVNDKESLDFLLGFDIPFVKIKNDRSLDFLIDYIPENIFVYISSDTPLWLPKRKKRVEQLWCVSKYPADKKDYDIFQLKAGECNISDHTENFDLFKEKFPKIIEWHYKLDGSTGLDAGSFSRTPEQLKEIL